MGVPWVLKVAIPVVAIPSAAGASYVVFFKQNDVKDSLKSLMEKESERIILEVASDKHDVIWTEIANEYKTSSIKVEGISKGSPDKKQIKKYCYTTSRLTDPSLLDGYKSLCSRSRLIDQINEDLKAVNKKWLTSSTMSDWTSLKQSYGTNVGIDLLIPKNDDSNTKFQTSEMTEDALMKWCQSVSLNLYLNKNSEDYKLASHNCTK